MEHSMSLVIFTFLSQLAIGAFATLFFLDVFKQKVSNRSTFISLISILVISAVAVVVSLFHLGHPFAAYKAILNFGDSWLTREIVFFPLFILFVIIYALAKTMQQKQVTGWLTIVLGIITIYSTAMIYTIPSVPAWNNGTTMAAFFTTALLLGPIFIQLLLSILEKNYVNFSLYTTVVAGLTVLFNMINLSILNGGIPAAAETAQLLLASPLFWSKIIFLIAAVIIAGNLFIKKKNVSLSSVSIIFACFLVAEFIGRMLFYSSGVHL